MQVCKKHGYCFLLYLFLINICRILHWEVGGGGHKKAPVNILAAHAVSVGWALGGPVYTAELCSDVMVLGGGGGGSGEK